MLEVAQVVIGATGPECC